MKSIGIIPARYASSRFPGKPLALIAGKPMIEWVYKRTLKSNLDYVVVATDDERIEKVVRDFGGHVVMTRKDHETGTDRLEEAVSHFPEYDIIINVQGDEPLIEKSQINRLVEALKNDQTIVMGTLKHKINTIAELENPNVVKVISDCNDNAIYFSRSLIPFPRNSVDFPYFRHLGIYAYKRDFLKTFTTLSQGLIEKSESLEQLRALENGYKIKILETAEISAGVDTKEDLLKIESYIIEKKIDI